MKKYDIIYVGAGPASIYSMLELVKSNKKLNILCIEKGKPLSNRSCPISEGKVKTCIKCNSCSIMEGFGGCGSFSDFKFPITNDFGGTLWKKIGKDSALNLMYEVDNINIQTLNKLKLNVPTLYKTNSQLSKKCLQNNLHLMHAEMRHIGTDFGKKLMSELFNQLESKVEFKFLETVENVSYDNNVYTVSTNKDTYYSDRTIIAVGRSGNKTLMDICKSLDVDIKSNKVDIGVRFECPSEIWDDITDEVYEAKIIYNSKTYNDSCRTFCMNKNGFVVNENTDGIITVNGHSNSIEGKQSPNTNFALLVSHEFTEPFKDSSTYGRSIAQLSNLLGGGVIVQRLGDLLNGQRTTQSRLKRSSVIPTLEASPGDLSLVLPKRTLDTILETIVALDKIVPGMTNPDNLLYGVEIKFYNSFVETDNNMECLKHKGLYFLGDGSGITHSLSSAGASGIFVAKKIIREL